MNNYLTPIKNDADLDVYEQYLRKTDTTISKNALGRGLFGHYLTMNKGKLVKVELKDGCRQKIKTGYLLDVGGDYIVIKVGNSSVSTAVPIGNIDCISFIHNDYRKSK